MSPGSTTLLLLPMMMSMAIVGLFWKLLYGPSWGIINYLLGLGKFVWLSNADMALLAIAITDARGADRAAEDAGRSAGRGAERLTKAPAYLPASWTAPARVRADPVRSGHEMGRTDPIRMPPA